MTSDTRHPDAAGFDGQTNGRALAAILIAVALATLDTAIANTALPAIAADLHAAPAASVWVINAYQLAMVATILPLAAFGDIIGHRRVYKARNLFLNRVPRAWLQRHGDESRQHFQRRGQRRRCRLRT